MSTNNKVFSVLVTEGNQQILNEASPGASITSLAIGQLGFFDSSGVAIPVGGNQLPTAGSWKSGYFAVGVGDGAPGDPATDVVKSPGIMRGRDITQISGECHSTPQPMIVDVCGFSAECDTEYGLKVEFENAQIGKNYGFNQLTKTFLVKTDCCEGCEDCPSGECTDLAIKMVNEVNKDQDGVIAASYAFYQGAIAISLSSDPITSNATVTLTIEGGITIIASLTAGDTGDTVLQKIADAISATDGFTGSVDGNEVIITGCEALEYSVADSGGDVSASGAGTLTLSEVSTSEEMLEISSLTGGCPAIRLTSGPAAIASYCNINLKYYASRQTTLKVSTIEGFNECSGVHVVTQQDVAYGSGLGYDIAQLEYTAGGWKGKPGPYRVGELIGLAFDDFQTLANKTTYYDQLNITYDQYSVGGWQEYRNNLEVIIAVPSCEAGEDTRTGIRVILGEFYNPGNHRFDGDVTIDGDPGGLFACESTCGF